MAIRRNPTGCQLIGQRLAHLKLSTSADMRTSWAVNARAVRGHMFAGPDSLLHIELRVAILAGARLKVVLK